MVKNLLANAGNTRETDSIPGSGRSPGSWLVWLSTPVFLSGESHGQRSLVGCGLWGHTESDMTKATEHTHILTKYKEKCKEQSCSLQSLSRV